MTKEEILQKRIRNEGKISKMSDEEFNRIEAEVLREYPNGATIRCLASKFGVSNQGIQDRLNKTRWILVVKINSQLKRLGFKIAENKHGKYYIIDNNYVKTDFGNITIFSKRRHGYQTFNKESSWR